MMTLSKNSEKGFIYLSFYLLLIVDVEAIQFPLNLVYDDNVSYALLELKRSSIFLNPNNVVQIEEENNSTLNSEDIKLKWNFTEDHLVQGHLVIKYITLEKEIQRFFHICPLYHFNTYAYLGQELFVRTFANFERPWYQLFLDAFTSSRCPVIDPDVVVSPKHIRMEILKPDDLECDKKINITLSMITRNFDKYQLPVIASAEYNGAIKCPDKNNSFTFLFYTKNSYLTDVFMD